MRKRKANSIKQRRADHESYYLDGKIWNGALCRRLQYSATTGKMKEVQVQVVDVYELAFPDHYELIYKFYHSVMEKGAKLYNLAYKKLIRQNEDSPLCMHIAGVFEKYMREEQPDLLIATYSLCAQVVSEYKIKHGSKIPLITCITDVRPHGMWINERTDAYLAASEETKKELIRNGVPAENIYICGMPISEKFYRSLTKNRSNNRQIIGETSKADLLKKNNLTIKKELLVMGGGLGMLPADKHFYKKLDKISGLHTTVITGKNKKLYRKLRGKYKNIKVVGYTEQIPEYMKHSDAIVTKPGGITTFEAIEARLPMIVFKPTLEQEVSNGDFIAQNGLGLLLDRKLDQATKEVDHIQAFLSDDQGLRQIKEQMKKLQETLHQDNLPQIIEGYRQKVGRS